LETWLQTLLSTLALPQYGLSTVFVVALLSATLLPLASEPAVLGLIKLNPALFWPAIVVATLGNTLGGAISWWMGLGAHQALKSIAKKRPQSEFGFSEAQPKAKQWAHARALSWLQRLGPKACLLSWLPVVGDPLCAVAGWLRLPFWPCVLYMGLGKLARYLTMTSVLLWMWPV
jgi:membrane protein YqaA with SNARE-associated domain